MYSTALARNGAPTQGVRTGAPPRPFSPTLVARGADFDELRDFLIRLRAELACDDEALLTDAVGDLVHCRGGIAWLIRSADRWHSVEASLGLYFTRLSPFSRQYRLRSIWNIVAPERRNDSGHAKSLLRAAELFADRVGVPALIEDDYVPGKHKLYTRHFGVVRVSYSTASPRNMPRECKCAVCRAHRKEQFEKMSAETPA